jgi:hypothetical protein
VRLLVCYLNKHSYDLLLKFLELFSLGLSCHVEIHRVEITSFQGLYFEYCSVDCVKRVAEVIWIVISRWPGGEKKIKSIKFLIKLGQGVNEGCEMLSEAEDTDVVKAWPVLEWQNLCKWWCRGGWEPSERSGLLKTDRFNKNIWKPAE